MGLPQGRPRGGCLVQALPTLARHTAIAAVARLCTSVVVPLRSRAYVRASLSCAQVAEVSAMLDDLNEAKGLQVRQIVLPKLARRYAPCLHPCLSLYTSSVRQRALCTSRGVALVRCRRGRECELGPSSMRKDV